MRKRNVVAWVCILAPWVLIPVVLATYVIVALLLRGPDTQTVDIYEMLQVENMSSTPEPTTAVYVFAYAQAILGFLGIIGILGIPIGAIVGVYLLSTKQGASIKPEQP